MVISEPPAPERSSTLEMRLAEAEDVLRAIRHGTIDAFVVEAPGGNQVYTLHSADEPYRMLVEQMQEGAVVLTARGEIVFANAAFAALVDQPLESVVGGRLDRFVAPSDRLDVETLIGKGSGRCRTRLAGSNSHIVEVSLSLSTTRSVSGDRLNLIVTDLSELLEAHHLRDRAERASRTKDEFLATFAHELRNPLAAIGGAASVLEVTRNQARSPAGAHAVIARQLDHISHLINDLLDVERVESGKLRLNRQPIDIEEAIRRGVSTFSDDATLDRRITISTEAVWADCDPVRFQQVLTNIMTNAVKYTPPGGQIRVALRAEDGDAVLSVEDTGFGIARALLPFVFDMYMQVDHTLAHAKGGLGIGLALVRRLVELHGGTVVASSDGEGRGSRFTVRLPQIAAPGHSVSLPEARSSPPRRVLLIEDSADARERLRLTLERAGHLVYDAADVERGLELLKTVRPDVGIIDISTHAVDRGRIARRFRQARYGRNMLLVALGLSRSPTDAGGPAKDGFDFHVAKPVDGEHLAHLLRAAALRGRPASPVCL
jgi:signal transduction histidine kinase/ActR/RegA family two-component response regulator